MTLLYMESDNGHDGNDDDDYDDIKNDGRGIMIIMRKNECG